MMRAYTQADTFNSAQARVSCRTIYERSARQFIRSKGNSRLEISTIISKDFTARSGLRIALVILIAAHLRKRGSALQTLGVGIALVWSRVSGKRNCDALSDCWPAAVTNMYESIIWGVIRVSFFGMISSRVIAHKYIFSQRTGHVDALLLVHQMPIAMPQASIVVPVLRDNFWLTIHVLTITLSYAAFALAMARAHSSLALPRNPCGGAGGRADAFLGCIACFQLGFFCSRQAQFSVECGQTILGRFWAGPKETGH